MALRIRCLLRVAGVIPRLLLNPAVRQRCGACASLSTRTVSSLVVSNTRCSSYALTSKTELLLRCFSSSPESGDVTYDQLKQILAGRSAVVLDVREPWELREYGSIPGSINVPLGQVNLALQLDPEEFKEKYGGDMPQPTDSVVFTCLAGVRSKKALDAATSLGYKDAQHYPGGWQDWAENEKLH